MQTQIKLPFYKIVGSVKSCSFRSSLIWDYTVCSGISVQILRINIVVTLQSFHSSRSHALILAILNKLRCPAHFWFSASQITWSQIHILIDKQCRSFFRSQLIWIYTVCKGRAYPGSTGPGLINQKALIFFLFFPCKHILWIFIRIAKSDVRPCENCKIMEESCVRIYQTMSIIE